MQQGLFVLPLHLDDPHLGTAKKYHGIINAFSNYYKVDCISDAFGKLKFNNNVIKDFTKSKNSLRFYYYNEYFIQYYHYFKNVINKKNYSFVYIRFPGFISFGLFFFIKYLKKNNPNAKFFLEIPTYPYAKEQIGMLSKIKKITTSFTTRLIKNKIDWIITFSADDFIWNIPTIKITNGYYNPELLDYIKNNSTETSKSQIVDKQINLCMIANFEEWHGVDLLIESIRLFQPENDTLPVHLYLIGDGLKKKEFEKIVEQKGLNKKITFTGALNVEQILSIIKKVDICIGSLGLHRIDVKIGSTLKNREYCFLGKPLVIRTIDIDFPSELFFVKYVPEGENPISIIEIINFYYKILQDYPDYENKIREYAINNLQWDKKVLPIIEKI